MEKEKIRFGLAVVAGVVVMFLFALVFVNKFQLVPFTGPFVGGLVSGLVAGKDFLNGGKAGISAGLIGAALVSLDFISNAGFLKAAMPPFPGVAGVLFLVLAICYFPILSFIGGSIGARLRG
ncbi:MAG TPA: DUF5518 domain-containing protein [Methanoregula sp.]|nr:DUF5518 domain-containing protein [Methanoregula sp.]